HVQADDSIWAQLIRSPTSQLPPVSIGEHPFVRVGVIHHVGVLSSMETPDVVAFVVDRDLAALIHTPQGHDARKVLGDARPLPPLRFRGSIVGPTAMHQIREDLEAAPTFGKRWSTAGPRTRRSDGSRSPVSRAGTSSDGSGQGRDVAWSNL